MSDSQRHADAVYYALTEAIDLPALEREWSGALTTDESAKLNFLRIERDRRDYLAAHVLLRQGLAAERGVDPKAPLPAQRMGWSLTHSRGMVACAIAAGPGNAIGIDAEPLAAAERLLELVDTFLTPGERAALPNDPNGRHVRMVEIWTAKEAVLKALGLGFSGKEGFGVLAMLESTPLGMLDEWATISVRDARTGAAYSVWQRWVGLHALSIVAIEGNEGKPRLMGVSL